MGRIMTMEEVLEELKEARQNGTLRIHRSGLVSIVSPKIRELPKPKPENKKKGGETNGSGPEQTQEQAQE